MSDISSARVEALALNAPRMALVVHTLPGLRMPRMVMQVCEASRITPTPLGDGSVDLHLTVSRAELAPFEARYGASRL